MRALGEALPFSDGAFGGCRIERVLMHVAEPAVVLGEACRCVESGGLVTVLEPDLARLEVTSDVLAPGAGWLSGVAHPVVGGELWRLVEEAGCQVLDRVEELSVWRVAGHPGKRHWLPRLGRPGGGCRTAGCGGRTELGGGAALA